MNTLLAAIASKLPNSIFMNIALITKVPYNVMAAMKTRFGQTMSVSKVNAQKQLFSMHCDNEKKMQEHLDHLAALKEETGKEAIFLALDLSSLASVTVAAAEFLSKEPELHMLFNNA